MQTKVTKEEAYVIEIPPEILEKYDIREGDEITIEEGEGCFTLIPHKKATVAIDLNELGKETLIYLIQKMQSENLTFDQVVEMALEETTDLLEEIESERPMTAKEKVWAENNHREEKEEYVSTKEKIYPIGMLKQLLEGGHEIESLAIGQMGKILEISEHGLVHFLSPQNRNCVTRFREDLTEIVYKNGRYFVRNPLERLKFKGAIEW